MSTHAANKLKMYKAIETVCTPLHTEWNSGFGSAYSRFAAKVAQLDLAASDPSSQLTFSERITQLIHEIDALLSNSLDQLVRFLQPDNNEFQQRYASVRIAVV